MSQPTKQDHPRSQGEGVPFRQTALRSRSRDDVEAREKPGERQGRGQAERRELRTKQSRGREVEARKG